MVDDVYEQWDFVPDLPEFCNYQDEGCKLADSCLNCPFPCCVHDLPTGSGTRLLREYRSAEILKRYEAGASINDLANTFRVSRRTIQRAIEKRNPP